MIRYKILGADAFDKKLSPHQSNINSDMGHFAIGAAYGEICFEEITPPPKQLWIKAKIEFNLCEDTAVIQKSGSSFVWKNDGFRCTKVAVTPTQIIYGAKDKATQTNLQIQPSVFKHQFATVTSIYGDGSPGTIGFWPCGGKVSNNILEIEQLYAQVSSNSAEQKVYLNSLSACSKLAAKTSGNTKFLFHPPSAQKFSLAAAINQGLVMVKISDRSLEYQYKSMAYEGKSNEQLQILCERKDQ